MAKILTTGEHEKLLARFNKLPPSGNGYVILGSNPQEGHRSMELTRKSVKAKEDALKKR
jgi:hypothetical protein